MNVPSSNQDGFILVEILSAMVVMAIAAIGFMQIVRSATFYTENSTEIQNAHYLALRLLDEERLSGLRSGTRIGVDDETGLNWEIQNQNIEIDASSQIEIPYFSGVTIVIWNESREKEKARIETRLIFGARNGN